MQSFKVKGHEKFNIEVRLILILVNLGIAKCALNFSGVYNFALAFPRISRDYSKYCLPHIQQTLDQTICIRNQQSRIINFGLLVTSKERNANKQTKKQMTTSRGVVGCQKTGSARLAFSLESLTDWQLNH
jgi:hypothetical protein